MRVQIPIALPSANTHRVVFRADVFRFAQSCAIAQSLNLHQRLQPLPHQALPVLDHHCFSIFAAACAQRSAQFAQFVVRSLEGIAQVLIGASGLPRRDGSSGSSGALLHLPWQERSITPPWLSAGLAAEFVASDGTGCNGAPSS